MPLSRSIGPGAATPRPAILAAVHAGSGNQLLDLRGDGGDDGVRIAAARGLDPGMLDHCAYEVQHHEGCHGRVQVDAHAHTCRDGIEAQHGPRLAGAAAFLAGLDDQVLVQQAAGNVGDGLRGQADDLGQLHPAQAAGGPADGVEDDGEVEVPHPGQVGSAPR